jgi:hypothetical protein
MSIPTIDHARRARTTHQDAAASNSTQGTAPSAKKANACKPRREAQPDTEVPPPAAKPNFGVHASPSGTASTAGAIASAGGLSLAQQSRVDAARDAIAPLCRELQGHGIDAGAFAQQYASKDHQNESPAQVRSHAAYQFMRTALTAHPELADAAVALRTRSLSPEQRDVVRRAASEAGGGVQKLAAAERAIASLGSLKREEVGDVRAMMNAGMRFGTAVRTERSETARPTVTEPTMDQKIEASVGRARAQGRECERMQQAVLAGYRRVPNMDWLAEKTVGLAAGTSTIGSLASADDSRSKGAALDNAAYAGGLIAGELRDQIGVAQGLYKSFSNDYAEYCAANRQLQQALRTQDHETIAATASRMETLVPRMKQTATALASAAKRVGEMDRRFDAAAEHAAIHVAISAMGAGTGAGLPQKAAAAAAENELAHHAIHLMAEAAANRGISKALDH